MSELTEEELARMAESWKADAEAYTVDLCRQWTKQIVGTNCAYVDDDLRILAHLADKAVDAGLTDSLPESILACIPSKPKINQKEESMSDRYRNPARPDDIPESVWYSCWWAQAHGLQEAASRSIMAAKAEEREACANIASREAEKARRNQCAPQSLGCLWVYDAIRSRT